MARLRNSFKRKDLLMRCWHGCGKRADGVVLWKNGDETPECVGCAVLHAKCILHGNIKQKRKVTSVSMKVSPQTILSDHSLVKLEVSR